MKAEYVDHMGSDLLVVNAARVSFDKESEWVHLPGCEEVNTDDEWVLSPQDEKLIAYLAKHNHFTPFTHCRETFKSLYISFAQPIVDVNLLSETERAGLVVDDRKARNSLYGWAYLINNGILEPEESMGISYHLHRLYPVSAKALKIPVGAEDKRVVHVDQKEETNPAFIDATIRETVPIFVARQRFKHTIGFSYNEVSRRYVTDEPEFYIPEKWRTKPEGSVKQGSGKETLVIDGVKCCENCGEKLLFLRKEDEKMKRFCSKRCQNRYYRVYTDGGWCNVKFVALQKSAEKRGIPFALSKDHLLALGRPDKCKYLNIDLSYDNEGLQYNSPSVNRINPLKGYEDGNIEIISQRANDVFHNLTPEEFKEFSKRVSLHRDGLFMEQTSGVEDFYEKCKVLYREMIEGGMAPEQARMFMPGSQYTSYYTTGSLLAWARAYRLRINPHAQLEIRELAKQWGDILLPLHTVSWKALTNVDN